MTELLSIDPSVSAEAVRSQLAKMRAPHVAIELPDGYSELNNLARLRLLQRQAQGQRSHIALITLDETTRKAAEQVGIPVFETRQAALQRKWQMDPNLPFIDPRRPAAGLPEPPPWRRKEIVERNARPSLRRARQERIQTEQRLRQPPPIWLSWLGYAVMASLLVLVLGGFVRFVLPAATVTLSPGRDTLSITFPLTANPNLSEADLERNELPARLVETTVEGSGSIDTTGSQEQATLKASGQVVFSNLGSDPVFVAEGTVVSTGTGQVAKFRTIAPVQVEGGVGARAFVNIEALEPGIDANVRASSITNIDGALRFRLRVSNPNPTAGGGTEFKRTVTEQDMNTLTQQVREQIESGTDYQALQKKLEPGEWLAEESIISRPLSLGFDQYKDEPADKLNLTLRLGVSGSAVNEATLRDLLISRVRSELPDLSKLIVNTLTVQRVPGAEALGDGSVRFTVTVKADYLVPIDPVEISGAIAGKNEDEASQILQTRWKLAKQPEFYRDPEFFGVLPSLPSRIQVRVDYGGE